MSTFRQISNEEILTFYERMNVFFFLTKMHVYEDLIMQALEILGLFMNNAR